jgi:hypothetical protein
MTLKFSVLKLVLSTSLTACAAGFALGAFGKTANAPTCSNCAQQVVDDKDPIKNLDIITIAGLVAGLAGTYFAFISIQDNRKDKRYEEFIVSKTYMRGQMSIRV